jgi:hypothetical protein
MALSSRVGRFNYHLHIPPICFQILMNSFYICKSCVWTNPFMLKRKFGFLMLMISHTGIWTHEPLFVILFQHMKLKRIYKCNINLHFLKTWLKLLRRLCNEKNLISLWFFNLQVIMKDLIIMRPRLSKAYFKLLQWLLTDYCLTNEWKRTKM